MGNGSNEDVQRANRPRIGIPVPTLQDPEYNEKCWPEYAAAVRDAGGEPVKLALSGGWAELRSLMQTCSGFVLPGSPADVNSELYGHPRVPETALPDPARESCDRLLLESAEATGKPVLGICFGLQFLNVWRGGTLVQDLQPVPVNHSAGPAVAVAHSVLVSTESMLGILLTMSEAPRNESFRRLPVNSSHHQAVAIPGDGLVVTAQSSQDGVIEALEGRIGSYAVIGVQWHPERSFGHSAASKALFVWLVSEALDFDDRAEPR